MNQQLGRHEIEIKRIFSRMGFGLFTMLIVTLLSQMVFGFLGRMLSGVLPNFIESTWFMWLLTVLPLYLVGFPAFYNLTKDVPESPIGRPKKMSFQQVIKYLIMCLGTAYIFNIVGNMINQLIGLIKGGEVVNPLLEVVTGTGILPTLIFAGILSPIVEEIIFRGIFLNKLRVFGDKTAIWVTALTFGLFHGNLSQFFYAFALGLILGYVAIKTNQIKYSVILHMAINILGSVIMPALALSGSMALMSLSGLIVAAMMIGGIILFIDERRTIKLKSATVEINPETRMETIYGSIGMILFFALCGFMFMMTILA